ncbi:conserved hypothetical protein [Ricinus communis]|uniref:Uncharacterized protein n=1 Tax=Ricinus communis TaxID=3988 RepID=B9TEE2_RICCO|nr:conserved hypothetical protein [Ricinus communis]
MYRCLSLLDERIGTSFLFMQFASSKRNPRSALYASASLASASVSSDLSSYVGVGTTASALQHKFLSLIGVITWDLANTHSSPVARGRRVKVFVFLCCYALSRLPISLPFDFDLSISKPASLL